VLEQHRIADVMVLRDHVRVRLHRSAASSSPVVLREHDCWIAPPEPPRPTV
jgi:hypothetical protein